MDDLMRQRIYRGGGLLLAALVAFSLLVWGVRSCSRGAIDANEQQEELVEDHLVSYPGRSIAYKQKFNDNQKVQLPAAQAKGLPRPPKDRADAAAMKKQLRLIETNRYYVVDELTHSVPYLVPHAKQELDSIGRAFAALLQRNDLPHYRFIVTSILRTQEDIHLLQRSGNVNSVSQSCHCYGTTIDITYARYDKVTRTRDYMTVDNLKLALAQILLNEQRAGRIYVKYEWRQACFHITVR